MSLISLPFIERPLKPLAALLALAFVFGTLDLVDALCFWGFSMDVEPIHIFQGIASGLVGSTAFHGGAATALLGALIHYSGYFLLLDLYYLALGRLPVLARQPYAYGLLYGLLTYLVIHYLILPMSAYHIVTGFHLAGFLNSILAQTLFVGTASGFLAHESHSKEKASMREPGEVQHATLSR
jgi:hypothetical protein